MALYKDGKLYGSYSSYGLSKKLGYHEIKLNDNLYSLHINKKGEWMMQVFKHWIHAGKVRMSLKDTIYDVNLSDPFKPELLVDNIPAPRQFKDDDDIPF